jgi:2-haloacid dehalogenase
MSAPGPDPSAFEVLTFDCYGTLIDWESGILAALRMARPEGWPVPAHELLERFAVHESAAERGQYRSYREVLGVTLRGIAHELGIAVPDEAVRRFTESVREWPPFSDSGQALRRLATRFRLGVITNCDDDLFAASNERLGVRFDWVVTAEQARRYKPDPAPFERALERIAFPRERVLHVAQSLYHDHVPAKRLGMTTVWIDRRHDKPGTGATPPTEAEPDVIFPSMGALAHAMVPEGKAFPGAERVDGAPMSRPREA